MTTNYHEAALEELEDLFEQYKANGVAAYTQENIGGLAWEFYHDYAKLEEQVREDYAEGARTFIVEFVAAAPALAVDDEYFAFNEANNHWIKPIKFIGEGTYSFFSVACFIQKTDKIITKEALEKEKMYELDQAGYLFR